MKPKRLKKIMNLSIAFGTATVIIIISLCI